MLSEGVYIQLLADLLNRDSQPKERERRIREANQQLYRAVVAPEATLARANLALAAAANRENHR